MIINYLYIKDFLKEIQIFFLDFYVTSKKRTDEILASEKTCLTGLMRHMQLCQPVYSPASLLRPITQYLEKIPRGC
jgi:hypothetical protein